MIDTERNEVNAKLAKAMGWTRTTDVPNFGYDWRDVTEMLQYQPPDFTRDATAIRELACWLAADEYLFSEFWAYLIALLSEIKAPYTARNLSMATMTASLETIALAAFAAIGKSGEK